MREKLNAHKSIALMLLAISFFLSLLISPETEGGIRLKWHDGVMVNFVLAVMYLVVMGREVKFHGWSATGSMLVLSGTFLGVFAIANVILISPFKGYGLLYAFLVELLAIINFRHLFMPFHHKGRQLTLNFLMVILFCVIFKFAIMAGIVPLLRIDPDMAGYLNMPLMAAIWTASLAIAFIGLYIMGISVKKENELQLDQFKQDLGLDLKHLLALGVKNEELIGLTKQEIEDMIHERIHNIIGESKRYLHLKDFVKQIPNPENSWAAPMVLESRPPEH
jgi:hypothetical protein